MITDNVHPYSRNVTLDIMILFNDALIKDVGAALDICTIY